MSKLNPNVNMPRENSGEIKNVKHLSYDCGDSLFIWQKFRSVVGYVVSWKHIGIGFYDNSDFDKWMNALILYTAMKIYRYKMKCRLTNSKSDRETLYNFVQ